jgi:hypothetical protein
LYGICPLNPTTSSLEHASSKPLIFSREIIFSNELKGHGNEADFLGFFAEIGSS